MKRKLLLYLCFSLCSFSLLAQKTVTGKITDANSEELIGVSILIQGTSQGTITNVNGDYSLQVPNNDAVLVFSYIGYSSVTRTVGANSVINIALEEDDEVLQEVVVSALGFKQNKDELGSTASVVKTETIGRSGEVTVLNSLAAKASNVQIARSNGDPGAGTTIRIRGANTITGSSNPLVIVDGVPISNSTLYGGGNGGRTGGTSQQSRLNDLNPNDIESVQVLKGASAAALWGSAAANGVLVITTKDGKAGRPKITYKATVSFDEVQERIPMQNTYGQGRSGVYGATRAESWGDYIPDRSGGADEFDTSGQYWEAENGTKYYPITGKNSTQTYEDSNWDAVFQTGGYTQHDLSVSGGKENASYFFSVGRLDQEGIIKESSYDRTNLRLNTKFILNEWLSTSTKVGFTNSFSNRIQQSSNTAGLMLGLMRTPPDFDQRDYIGTYYSASGEAFPLRQRSYRRYLGNTSNPTYNNAMWTVFEQEASTRVNRFLVSQAFDVTPTDWLTVTLRGGVDNSNDQRVYFMPVGTASNVSGRLSEDIYNETMINFDGIVRGSFNLTSDIDLTATVGFNYNDQTRRTNGSELQGFLVNVRKSSTALNSANEASSIYNRKRFLRSNRGYALLSFALFDQLYVNLSGTSEASSAFNGTVFYPAADVAWQFTDGGDMGPLSFGKLRVAYGQVGILPGPHLGQTLAEGAFTYSTYSDPLDISRWGGGFRVDDDKGNDDLKPEIKTEFEIGTDLRFFDDKLSLGMTYYQNKIEDMLLRVDVAPSTGYDTQYSNAAEMENKGFEVEFDYRAIEKGDFTLNVYGNWATNDNKVLNLAGTTSINLTPGASVSSRAIVGQPLGVLFGTGSKTNADGSYDLTDNGFPQITDVPEVLGDPNPDWRAGLGFKAQYKGLSLSALVDHQQGGDFSPRTLWVLRRFGTTEETANTFVTATDLVNYAGNTIPSGTRVRGNIQNFGGGDVLLDESWYRTGIGGGFGDNQAYNFSLFDATNTRLREITLAYTLSGSAFREKSKLSSITFSASGRNLFQSDNIPGIDPEINQTGVSNGFGLDYFTNPSTKSFLFSISINY